MKVGLLGGTFDPPHSGHLGIAQAAIDALGLDEVLFIPTARNPVKKGRAQSSPKDRMAMLKLAIDGHPKFGICDMEIVRGGISYTHETVMDLSMVRPADYWLLLGSDNLATFTSWKNPEKIVRYCRLGVVSRGVHSADEIRATMPEMFRPHIDFVPMKTIPISSSQLRDRAAVGKSLLPWVSVSVQQYIQQQRLYR